MKFIANNANNMLNDIRIFGHFNLNDKIYSTTIDEFIEDQTVQNPLVNEDAEKTIFELVNINATMHENDNLINESIINLIINESKILIDQCNENAKRKNDIDNMVKTTMESISNSNSFTEEDLRDERICENINVAEKKSKKWKTKLKLHTCSGTIKLKNIANVTINTNCKGFVKRSCLSRDDADDTIVSNGNTSYNCAFYDKFVDKIKSSSDIEDMPSSDDNTSSSSKPCTATDVKNLSRRSRATALGKKNIICSTHIEEWLKQIFVDAEIEPMGNNNAEHVSGS